MSMYSELKSEITQLAEAGVPQPYLLYAMGLRLGTLDYDVLATDNLLDGPG
jgi:hypothetical protein